MKRNTWHSFALIFTVLCAVFMFARPAEAQSYLVTDLGFLPGPGGFAQASGINNGGQIVGVSDAGPFGDNHGFLWKPAVPNGMTGSLFDLGGLSATVQVFQANAINDAGQIVGAALLPGTIHAVSIRNGAVTDLGVLPNFARSTAVGINNNGQIVGTATRSDGITHAFLVSGGKTTDLGTLPGGTFSAAAGINDAGEIIGTADNAAGTTVPFLFCNGVMHDLSGPGGLPGLPTAINNSGQIAGNRITDIPSGVVGLPDDMIINGFLWTPATPNGLTGTAQDLGEAVFTTALNASGVVVGTAGSAISTSHAFVLRDGMNLDLNGLIPGNSGVILDQAVGINGVGQIIVNGRIGFEFHAFLLTPNAGPTLPSIPTGVLATAGNARVTLTWNPSLQATSYRVKRALSNAGPFTTIATVNAPTTQYVDLTVQNGMGYYYLITAVNSVGESPNSLLTFAFPLPNPTSLTATAGIGQVVLRWKQPAGIRVNANIIYRSEDGVFFTAIAALNPTTTFTDRSVVPGRTYIYRVTAYARDFGSRETPPSNTATATPH